MFFHDLSSSFMTGKTTEWFTCMGGAARCLMSDVYWGSAVGTTGTASSGRCTITGWRSSVPGTDCGGGVTVAECWVDRWD